MKKGTRVHKGHVYKPFINIPISAGEVDPEAAVQPADELGGQALAAAAEDMAVEDTLYALERALQGGHLPADVYLKQVPPSDS